MKRQLSAWYRLAGLISLLALSSTSLAAHSTPDPGRADPVRDDDLKIIQLPIRTDGPKSLDPARGSTVYDNMVSVQSYETLLETRYTNPLKHKPLLLAKPPTRLEEGRRWRFELKKGVFFHDDDCFPGGNGRELVTDDVFYSWKRLADKANTLKNWWLLENTIVGFDEYKEAQNAATKFDYDAPVEGLVKIDDHNFEVVLKEPVYKFIWVLTQFQTSVLPREAVEHYGKDFSSHPVGTGPFILEKWVPKKSVTFNRNRKYHGGVYPSGWNEADSELGMHEAAGTPVPIADRLELTMFVQDQPMWLKFQAGRLAYTEVPAENFDEAFNKRTKRLRREYRRKGIQGFANPLLDFIFIGFNMEDPVLGGYGEKKKALRQAISLASDWDERNESFYNSKNIIYDGPIPPQLEGYPKDGKAPVSYRGPHLEKARELMIKAGYPDGEGLAPIKYYASRSGNIPEQAELFKRQVAKIGVRLDIQLVDFSTLIEYLNYKKAPLFSYAWSSDYPDAENNLALFYGPYASPGSNRFNYSREEYDRMYEKARVMEPSAERTALFEKMRDMIIEDAPYLGSMARERHYLVAPWVRNCRPTERFWSWFKYLDVDDSKR